MNSLSKASRDGPDRVPGALPIIPSVASRPTVATRSVEARPSVKNDFAGSQLPVRTSAGPTFAKVSGKSMITNASGLPEAICAASEL